MNKIMRKSNIECLRIIAMLMIVFNHFAGHGVMHVLSDVRRYQIWRCGKQINMFFSSLLRPGGEVGVAIFFMISGYFCIHKEKVKVLKITLQTLFYGLLMTIIFIITKAIGIDYSYSDFSTMFVIKASLQSILTPVSGGLYWFVTVYINIMLLIPLINPMLLKLNKKGFCFVILVAWFFWYAFASTGSIFFQLQKGLFFYVIGAYCNIHLKKVEKRAYLIILFGLTWILGGILSYNIAELSVNDYMETKLKLLQEILLVMETGIVVPICSVTLFRFFESIDMKPIKIINDIAATTFGIYLFHDSLVGRNLIWNIILKVDIVLYQSNWFPLISIGAVLIVFAFCSAIDLLRMKCIEPFYIKKANLIMAHIKDILII